MIFSLTNNMSIIYFEIQFIQKTKGSFPIIFQRKSLIASKDIKFIFSSIILRTHFYKHIE